jgi:hypothetical protein
MINESFHFICSSEYDDINSGNIDNEDISQQSNISNHSNYISTKNLAFELEDNLAESQGTNSLNNKSEEEHKNESSEISLLFSSTSRQSSTNFTNKNKLNKKRKNTHNNLSSDNLLRKVQVHYFSFLISFLNYLLELFKYDYKFLELDYRIKKNINKNEKKRKIGNVKIINSFDDVSVEKIISQKRKKQCKKYDESHNLIICEAVKRNKILYNILKDKHLNIFKKFYFTTSKLINLKEYGEDKCIKLPNEVKTHIDLLKDNSDFGEEEYKKSINQCIIKNFFPKSKFFFY